MQPCGQKDHIDPIKNYHTKKAHTFRWKENRYEWQESIVNNGQIGADTKKNTEVNMHSCLLYLALRLHFTFVLFSIGFLRALKQWQETQAKRAFWF